MSKYHIVGSHMSRLIYSNELARKTPGGPAKRKVRQVHDTQTDSPYHVLLAHVKYGID